VGTLPTQRTFTGQYSHDAGLGSLMYFNARYMSPALGRFVSADTLVPGAGNPQALNRYMFVLGNPLKYIDPNGHEPCETGTGLYCDDGHRYSSGEQQALQVDYEEYLYCREQYQCPYLNWQLDPAFLEEMQVTAEQAQGVVLPNGISILVMSQSEKKKKDESESSNSGGGKSSAPNPQENRRKGDAFRDEIADQFRKAGYKVETEVTKKTPLGARRVDVEVSKDGRVLGGIETKTGNSRYTASQRAKDNWLRLFADYIVNLVRKK
jgi:RHS repeat-associated protein